MPGDHDMELLDFFRVATANGRSRLEVAIVQMVLAICFLRPDR
jgi:hypothetical protein